MVEGREKAGRWDLKKASSNELRKKTNLLNMIAECEITLYNTTGISD